MQTDQYHNMVLM